MGEYVWTSVYIGGPIPLNRIDDLVGMIEDTFSEHDHVSYKDIEGCIKRRTSLDITGNVNYGNPEEITDFCKSHGMTFWVSWCAAPGCFDAGIKISRQDKDEEEIGCNDESEPTMTLKELRTYTKTGGLAAVIARLEQFTPDAVPPLTSGAPCRPEDPLTLARDDKTGEWSLHDPEDENGAPLLKGEADYIDKTTGWSRPNEEDYASAWKAWEQRYNGDRSDEKPTGTEAKSLHRQHGGAGTGS